MIDPSAKWVDELAERVGHFGLGAWLTDLGFWIGAKQPFPPLRSARFVISRGNGIEVRLHDPRWQKEHSPSPDDWVLYSVTIDGHLRHMPFGLSSVDTPESAARKLSHDTAKGNGPASGTQKISYFLADLRVVAVTFTDSPAAVSSIELVRLYDWPDWRKGGPASGRRP